MIDVNLVTHTANQDAVVVIFVVVVVVVVVVVLLLLLFLCGAVVNTRCRNQKVPPNSESCPHLVDVKSLSKDIYVDLFPLFSAYVRNERLDPQTVEDISLLIPKRRSGGCFSVKNTQPFIMGTLKFCFQLLLAFALDKRHNCLEFLNIKINIVEVFHFY